MASSPVDPTGEPLLDHLGTGAWNHYAVALTDPEGNEFDIN